MKIQYLGHACFKLSSGDNSLVIDPYQDGSVPGLKLLRDEATKVITSHQHADHSGIECIKTVDGNPDAFKITPIPTWHDDQQGALRGPNTIHIIECEKFRVAHFGDLGCQLSDNEKQLLKDLDVIMVPVGGHFTIDADQAAEIVKELTPKCIIPMHYRGSDFGYDVLGTVDLFTRHFTDVREIDDTLELGEDLPEVAVMSFKR